MRPPRSCSRICAVQPATRPMAKTAEKASRRRLDLLGEADAVIALAQRRGNALQHVGARVAHAIDTMAEAHQPLAARERIAQPRVDPGLVADRIEHVEHWTRR